MHRSRRVCVWAFIIITLLCTYGCQKEDDSVVLELQEVQRKQEKEENQKDNQEQQEETKELLVHVCGQVQHPGVYRLQSGSRIFEALEAAGGILETAAGEALNQAEAITDGQQIYVPSKEEQVTSKMQGTAGSLGSNAEEADGRVNINTATKEELMTLDGIGEARAASIISYREQNGSFQTIEELKAVEGIKDGIFNKIMDKVKVG